MSFFVKRSNQQTSILVVNLIKFRVVVALQRKLRLIQTIADIDDSCISQPLYTPHIISVTCVLAYLCYLETLVLFGKERRDVAIDSLHLSFIQTFYILGDIFLIVFQQLTLNSQSTAEIVVLDIRIYHLWHTAYSNIIAEKTEKNVHLQIVYRLDLQHVLVKVVYKFL